MGFVLIPHPVLVLISVPPKTVFLNNKDVQHVEILHMDFTILWKIVKDVKPITFLPNFHILENLYIYIYIILPLLF